MWEIRIAKRAKKELEQMQKPDRIRLTAAIDKLSIDPYDSLKMAGFENYFRVRVGDFRIIFEINKDRQLVIIQKIGKRENVYLGY